MLLDSVHQKWGMNREIEVELGKKQGSGGQKNKGRRPRDDGRRRGRGWVEGDHEVIVRLCAK